MSCVDSPGRTGYSGEGTIIGQQVATDVEPSGTSGAFAR